MTSDTTIDQPSTPVFFEQTWDLAYRHALGDTVGAVLSGLQEKRLVGRRCSSCERVLFPARSFCDRCHVATDEWVDVAPRGRVEMFTIVYESFPGMLVDAPYVLAYVLLEGADTAAVGYIRGLDLSDVTAASGALRTGTAVEVLFVDEPEGKITDFWFEVDPSS
jgi:uncharacterized protein